MSNQQIPIEFQAYVASVSTILLIYFSKKLPDPWMIAANIGVVVLIFEVINAIIRHS